MLYLISIGVVIIGSIIYDRIRIVEHRVNYFTIFAFSWLVILTLGLINPLNLNPTSNKFMGLLTIGISLWIIGFMTSVTGKRYVISIKKNEADIQYYNNKIALTIYLCVIATFCIILTSIYLFFRSKGFTYGMFHMLAYGGMEEDLFSNRIANALYRLIMYPMVLSAIPIISMNIIKKESVFLSVSLFVVILYYCFIIGRRFPILYIMVDFILAITIFGISIQKKTIKNIVRLGIILFIFIFFVTAWRKRAFETGNWQPVYETFLLYFNLCLPVGDYWINYIDKNYSSTKLYGYAALQGLIDNIDLVIRAFGVRARSEIGNMIIYLPEENYISIGGGNRANAFVTWIYYLYVDFRTLGVVIGSYFFGKLSGYVENGSAKYYEPNNFYLAIYLLFSQCIIKMFVRFELGLQSYIMAFFFLRLAYYKTVPEEEEIILRKEMC